MSRIPSLYMRGGTSKGVFFNAADLPSDPAERDAVLLRVIGSPDPYRRHTDGMGGATSSTSKVVLLSPSAHDACDVDYLFGAVAIDAPLIDWSGNCGNLSAAVGPAALHLGLMAPPTTDGIVTVRIWQKNIGQIIIAHVPVANGLPLESGDYHEDGVAFSGAAIALEFLENSDADIALLPTGNIIDKLDIPGLGIIEATLLTAGNPTVFIDAASLGLDATELPDRVNADFALLKHCEAIRACAAVRMGLAPDIATATQERPATPKLAWVAPPARYTSSAGVIIDNTEIDVLARILSMGQLHHAFTGTGAIALAVAAALPGSVVARQLRVVPESAAGKNALAGAARHPQPLIPDASDPSGAVLEARTPLRVGTLGTVGAPGGAEMSGSAETSSAAVTSLTPDLSRNGVKRVPPDMLRLGHVSGRLAIGATVREDGRHWRMERAILSRSARIIMSGWVHLPSPP